METKIKCFLTQGSIFCLKIFQNILLYCIRLKYLGCRTWLLFLFSPKNKQIYGSACCIFYSQRNDYQWESLILSAHIYFLQLWARLWQNCKLYMYMIMLTGPWILRARLGGRKVITARHFIAAKMLRRVLHRRRWRRRFVSNCRSEWAAAVILLTGASSRLAPRRDLYIKFFSLRVTGCVYNIITLRRIEGTIYIYLGGPNCTAPWPLQHCILRNGRGGNHRTNGEV